MVFFVKKWFSFVFILRESRSHLHKGRLLWHFHKRLLFLKGFWTLDNKVVQEAGHWKRLSLGNKARMQNLWAMKLPSEHVGEKQWVFLDGIMAAKVQRLELGYIGKRETGSHKLKNNLQPKHITLYVSFSMFSSLSFFFFMSEFSSSFYMKIIFHDISLLTRFMMLCYKLF